MAAAASQRDRQSRAPAVPAAEPLPSLHGSDEPVVDLLRGGASLNVPELTAAMGVTATAVRQRLQRLMKAGVVVREPSPVAGAASRGRPSYVYRLSEMGRRLGGDNFRDLAMVLWQEVRRIEEPSVRRGLLARIGRSLAEACLNRTDGFSSAASPADRLSSLATALQDRQIACECSHSDTEGQLAVLTTHTCPYPQLAEVDRGICAAERVMLEELVEAPVRLTECRLDGDACCRFTVSAAAKQPAAASRRGRQQTR